MKRQMTPGETLREFCRTWFVKRDAEGTLAFLTEDVGFVGTGADEMASGRQRWPDILRRISGRYRNPLNVICLPSMNSLCQTEYIICRRI